MIATDLGFEENCKRVVEEVVNAFGRIDVLVNCAAEQHEVSTEDIDEARLERVFRTNIFSQFFLAKKSMHMGQFYLPVINLDINTETVLRNLVAYEASNTSGPPVFTRYTELINGIIDSEEDVRLLREQGVLVSRLKSDQEAAEMWNGMSKSVRLTRVGFLDKTIEDVNRYYTGRWKVKFGRFVEVYLYGSWQIFAFFAAVLLLILLSLQVLSLVFSSLRLLRLRTG